VGGDGTPRRAYLYAADLAAWLWTLLVRGRPGVTYNVGAEGDLSIADLARLVSLEVRPGTPVEITRTPTPGQPPSRYVPSTRLAREELGLEAWVALPDAIRRTAAWWRSAQSQGR
jgi:dTDP-glucose 4,6-dehydratase